MSEEAGQPQATGGKGIHLPVSAIITIVFALATLISAYVFATKAELGAERERIIVLEETTKHQDEDIGEIKESVRTIDQNLRTLMSEQGVPEKLITKPKEKKR